MAGYQVCKSQESCQKPTRRKMLNQAKQKSKVNGELPPDRKAKKQSKWRATTVGNCLQKDVTCALERQNGVCTGKNMPSLLTHQL